MVSKGKIRKTLAMCQVSVENPAVRKLQLYVVPGVHLAQIGVTKVSDEKPRNEIFLYYSGTSYEIRKDTYMYPLSMSKDGMEDYLRLAMHNHEDHGTGTARLQIARKKQQGASSGVSAARGPGGLGTAGIKYKRSPDLLQPELGC